MTEGFWLFWLSGGVESGGLPVASVHLATPRLHFGLYTNDLEGVLSFWQGEVGRELEEVLPVGLGVRQQRHALNGSVFKLNHSCDPLPEELTRISLVCDPDGNWIELSQRASLTGDL